MAGDRQLQWIEPVATPFFNGRYSLPRGAHQNLETAILIEDDLRSPLWRPAGRSKSR